MLSRLILVIVLVLSSSNVFSQQRKVINKAAPKPAPSAHSSSKDERIVSINAFDLSYTGGLRIASDKAKEGDDANVDEFKINLNYAQTFAQLPVGMMGKAVLNIERTNQSGAVDATNSLYGIGAGVLHNLQANDLKNSVYFGGQFGLERQVIDDGSDDHSGFNMYLYFEGGKRWDLGTYSVANISYSPSVDFKYTRYGGDIREEFFTSGTDFRINFLKFDILF